MPSLSPETQFDNFRPRTAKVVVVRRSKAWLLFILLCLSIAALVTFEVKTSFYQAKFLHEYAKTLTYHLVPEATDSVVYPSYGPFDERHGYSTMPKKLARLTARDYQIAKQVAFSPKLKEYANWGFFPPYHEKAQSGLSLLDCRRKDLFAFAYPKRAYQDNDVIPKEIVNTLLFIENREMWTTEAKLNPVVDWPRFVVAGVSQIAEMLGANVSTAGGSTLATQIEKFRHSAHGLTLSIKDKLLQIGSASIRVYQQGEQTEPARKRIVQDYLNTVPLSSAPNYGEVHGIGDGLWAWFKTDFDFANTLLKSPHSADNAVRRGQVFRQIVALMIAQRRPSYYLLKGHSDLETSVDSHLRLLAKFNLIDPALMSATLAQRLAFNTSKSHDFGQSNVDKGINSVRIRTAGLLGTDLYGLDRLDLKATTSLHGDLQKQVSQYLRSLSNVDAAAQAGLLGERLLQADKLKEVLYSFTLYQKTATANKVRIQTDSTDQPFDINEGSKLELGSTAKLRVLATYLEIVAELHQKFSPKSVAELYRVDVEAKDHITRWVVDYLIQTRDLNLKNMLDAALQRKYSASPYEKFFTGGGLHVFNNFRKEENNRIPTLYQALQDSVNLPFVRLMRDLVNYSSSYNNDGSLAQLLRNDKDPRREEYLRAFADREGAIFVGRAFKKYQNKTTEQRLEQFFDSISQAEHKLAASYRYLLPDNSVAEFHSFLSKRLANFNADDKQIDRLYYKYGPDKFNLADQGYIARVHPLELWVLSYMLDYPEATQTQVREASRPQRQEVYRWLFRTRHKNARDVRVKVMLEVEAFLNIHQRWVRLGYPFDHLVPSLGSALGSSGDRPAALAELMGIIQNNGYKLPSVKLDELHFAEHTPYEVLLNHQSKKAEYVMRPEVAQTLKGALENVVQQGTGRRLKDIFKDAQGQMIPIGGKTGTGDNRIVTEMRLGRKVATTAMNRTATFVFFLGEHYFGTLTAFVPGVQSDDFSFTSALPLQVFKGMVPILSPYLQTPEPLCD